MRNLFLLTFVCLLFCSNHLWAQNSKLTNYKTQINFTALYTYDIDIDKLEFVSFNDAKLIIDVDSYGKGKLILYSYGEKYILTVEENTYDNDIIYFKVKGRSRCTLNLNRDKSVNSFAMDFPNNISLVYGYY